MTGSSSSMGKATTKMLVEFVAKVYALDIHPCIVEGIEKFIEVDLSNKQAIDKAFESIPDMDCFFGEAGLSGAKTDYITTFNVNYTAGVAVKQNMEECKKILGISTWEAIQDRIKEIIPKNTPSQLAYMYSKRLANAYSCQLAVELGSK